MENEIKEIESSFSTVCRFNCVCGKEISTRPPVTRIINYPEFSGVIVTHERITRCECGLAYLPVVLTLSEKGEIRLVWKRLKLKDDKKDKPYVMQKAVADGIQ